MAIGEREMKSDFHMHTNFSTDSDSAPEQMIEGAIQKGLQTICFTDHYDKDYPKQGDTLEFYLDTASYYQKMKDLQERYQDKIEIRIGVELGLQPHLGEYYKNYVTQYPFDFVIGSVHVVDKCDPYYGKLFDGRSDEETYRRCFEVMLEDVKRNSDFDVLGHMDYVVRYGKAGVLGYSYRAYADIVDEILKYIIEHGKGIEFNTSGYKYGLGFGHPHPDILKRYRELGGEIITVGSDGHKPEHIAYDFHKVSDILRACGFENYTEFKQRKPIFRQLP